MRTKRELTLAAGIAVALVALGWSGQAEAQRSVGGGCFFYDSLDCEAGCTDVGFEVDCDADVAVACEGQCTFDAKLDCGVSCQASCIKECELDPGSFTCEGYCEADCGAQCEAYCESEPDSATCVADCQSYCAVDCGGYCEAKAPELDCELACKGSCDATCRAAANVECNAECAAEARVDCEAEVTGECSAECLREGGLLVCEGDVPVYGDYDTLVSEGYIVVELEGSISCATVVGRPGSGTGAVPMLLVLLGVMTWAVARRRRAR